MPSNQNRAPAPFIDVVNAKLPGSVARMRADTVRGGWRAKTKGTDKSTDGAAPRKSTRKRAPRKSAEGKSEATSTATAGATTEVKE